MPLISNCFLRLGLAVGLGFLITASGLAQSSAPQTSVPQSPAPQANDSVIPQSSSSPANPDSSPTEAANPAASPATTEQAAPGQEPSAQPSITPDAPLDAGQDQGRFVFKKEVEEVVLHATVVDDTGRLVTSLDKGAFSIFQNGKLEPITSFRREDVPVAMGIVIDNSGSMRDKRDKVNQAVMDLIRASNPDDEIFVVNFSQTPYLDQDYTSDANLLQAALHQVAMRGSTALYDAVVASAVHLQHNPRLDKKVLLVITDGQDNMSRETLQEAMHRLQPGKGGATVYAIGLTDQGLTRAGHDALQNLAMATGGVAFFPGSLSEVNSIASSVARDIRSQYILAYKPGNPGNSYQAIQVEARAPGSGRLTVRTRTGYYPGEKIR